MKLDGELNEIGRLENFPITLFAVIMGLSGLSIAYQRAYDIYGLPSIIGDSLAILVILLFCTILFFYLFKWIKYPKEVKDEFFHPIRVNFFAAISISMLLLSVVYKPIFEPLSTLLFWSGAILHTFFTLHTISFWINHNFELTHSNPAWFIPIVGNVIVPVAGVGITHNEFLMFYFSVGMLFWIVLFTVIFYRIIFHNQLAQKFIPTLFILIAPPAVGFIAYIKLSENFDMFANFLLNIGLFFTFLLFFMFKNFTRLKFFISWWAFTFPLAAITLATMLAYELSGYFIYKLLSLLFLGVTTIIVIIVATRTIEHILKKEICVKEG